MTPSTGHSAGPNGDAGTPLEKVSFASRRAAANASIPDIVRILPDVNVIKIGGQSIMDRGRAAVYPLVEEIVEAQQRHKILIGAGGGTRARHAYSIALDCEMPTGVLAKLGITPSRQNARMLQMLLARHGAILIEFDEFVKLPLYFRMGCIPIMVGMPPNEYWEKPAASGRIPSNRTDAGVYLGAEYLGARSCTYVKDEKGLFTADPKKDRGAKFIPRIHARELLEMDLGDLVLERVVLQYLLDAKSVKEVQIINGLEKGNLVRALDGESVGTVIYAD